MSTPSLSSTLHNGTYRTRYLFNGKELDTETNLYYYGARYFEPQILTWYGVDPLTEKYPFNSGYVYCNANPVKYVDPDGREKMIFFDTSTNNEQVNNDNQTLINRANSYNDHPEIIHLWAHGSPDGNSFQLIGNNEVGQGNIYEFFLSNSFLFNENESIQDPSIFILHSCFSGCGDESIAESLSNLLPESIIIAPTEAITSFKNQEVVNDNGVWNVYYNGQIVETLPGNTDFQTYFENKSANEIFEYYKNLNENNQNNP